MVKTNGMSNIFQVYLIWLNDTTEKCYLYWPPASYIMVKQLTGKREWKEEEAIFVRLYVHISHDQVRSYYPTEALAIAQFWKHYYSC